MTMLLDVSPILALDDQKYGRCGHTISASEFCERCTSLSVEVSNLPHVVLDQFSVAVPIASRQSFRVRASIVPITTRRVGRGCVFAVTQPARSAFRMKMQTVLIAARLSSLSNHVSRVCGSIAEKQMRRSYASRVVAVMQNPTATRVVACSEQPRDSMCEPQTGCTPQKLTVAALRQPTNPYPAAPKLRAMGWDGAILVYTGPEAFGNADAWTSIRRACFVPTLPVKTAHSPRELRALAPIDRTQSGRLSRHGANPQRSWCAVATAGCNPARRLHYTRKSDTLSSNDDRQATQEAA